ncbi:hypothetical protein LINGRAHAP2_LOCUS15887 [Linum grandiflorum]
MENYSSTVRAGVMAVLLMSTLISLCQLGKANNVPGGNGSSSASLSLSSNSNNKSSNDPAQIVAKAMQCFNNNTVYKNCDEELRLNESGSLRAEQMEAYCRGSCFTENNLVLNCLEGIMNNFRFYNNATINDVRDTFKATCSSTSSTTSTTVDAPSTTGNVEVAPKHLQASQTNDVNAASWSLYVVTCVMASQLTFLRW